MKAHRTDLVSLAFGLVFLALSVWWLLARILGLTVPPVGWFLAGALVLIGVLGLAGALRSGRHADRDAAAPTDAEATVSAPYDGGPGLTPPAAPEADEWSTDAVGDDAVGAAEDRPVSGGAGDRRWSPSATPADPGPPTTGADAATREQPTLEVAPATREQPTVDLGPTSPGRSTGGDAPAIREQRTAGDGPAAGPDGEERSPG
ncbi:hypothetical protein GA0070613_2706 [Micromonospora inositola]|uniref:Uncharacterized protein n=1 Tax=Micromonospora inositola TaxID=47865 RepID=A0A1C5IE63_9ACTN|nr:hypothetical protein GA0070613_2706 [Micromonospora inositola]